jgi:SH3 domain protein
MKNYSNLLVFIFLSACILFSASVNAESMYVTDKMKITFRTGPGNDRKIISLLDSGQEVEVVEPQGDWARVMLPDGKEGWVLARYLSDKTPCRIEIESLRRDFQELKMQTAKLDNENSRLKIDREQLTTALKKTELDLKNTKKNYAKLIKESAHFLELKATHEKTVASLSRQTKRVAELDETLSKYLKNQTIKWFLAGGGVLILGFIIGFISKRQKRQSLL